MKHRMSKKDRAGASRSGQPVPMSFAGLATSPFVPTLTVWVTRGRKLTENLKSLTPLPCPKRLAILPL
jgi:hypothetical protein